MKGVTGMSAELRLHHNQSSGTLEGFPQGNRQTGGEEPLPSAGVGGPTSPACLSLVPHAMRCTWVFCQAGGEGDPPSSPPEIVPILILPQCWVPIGTRSPSSA